MLTHWRVTVTAAIFCTGMLLSCLETGAQSIPKEVAARTEIYAIPSLTISDQQFLTGDAAVAGVRDVDLELGAELDVFGHCEPLQSIV